MKIKIDIDIRTILRFWLVLFGILAIVYLIYFTRQSLSIIAASMFLAVVLNKPVSKITKILPGKSRVGATALAYTGVMAILITVIVLIIPPILSQTVSFIKSVPTMLDSAASSPEWAGINARIDRAGLRDSVNQLLESIKNNSSSIASNLGLSIVSGAGSIISLLVMLVFVLVLAFLMLIEGPKYMNKIWNMYGEEHQEMIRNHRRIVNKLYNVINGYVIGQATVATVAASVSGVIAVSLTFFFNVGFDLVAPVIATVFVFGLIPAFGATISTILVGLLFILNDVGAGITFMIAFIIYQQIENNLIAPMIQSKSLDLSPLLIFVAVIFGTYSFGLVGGIVAIPIFGCLKVLIDELILKRKKAEKELDKPITKLINTLKKKKA